LNLPSLQTITGSNPYQGVISITYFDTLEKIEFSGLEKVTKDIVFEAAENLVRVNFDNLLSVGRNISIDTNILDGLSLPSLETVYELNYNNNIPPSLNLNSLISAKSIVCSYSNITSADLSSLETIPTLRLDHNRITSLHLDNLISSNLININNNDLIEFGTLSLETVGTLDLSFNEIETLDFPAFTGDVGSLRLYANQLTDITFGPNLTSVDNLLLESNQFVTLDISNVPVKNTLNLDNNQLLTVFIKNGTNENLT